MSYKIAPLTVNPQKKSNILSRVFVSQPSAEEELLVGRLFVLLELETERTDDERVADVIIGEAYRQYYEHEAFLLRDRLSHIKPEVIFEAAIAKLNRGLGEFLEQKKINLRVEGFSAIIGVLYGNKLFFAQSGTGKALLLYRPKNKRGEFLPDFSLVDITEKTSDPTQEIDQVDKFFTNIIAGAVPAHGYFFFANEALFEYLTRKQLTDIITTLPPNGAAEQIKNLLEQTNAFVPFFGLIIKNTTGEHDAFAAPAATIAVPGSLPVGLGRSSVQQFNSTQENTEQLLNPSGVINLKKWLGRLAPVSSGLKKYASDKAKRFNITKERVNIGQRGLGLGRKLIAFIGALIALIINGLKRTVRLITNPTARQEFSQTTKQNIKKSVETTVNTVDRFQRLNKKHKILVVIVGLCIIALLGNIIYSSIKGSQRAADEKFAAVSTQFNQKENQLEAALLYNNRDGARQILDEMGELISSLPSKTDQDKTRLADFKTLYEKQLDSIYNITRISAEAFKMDLPGEANQLLANDTIILAISEKAKSVWKINLNSQNIDILGNDNFPTGKLAGVSIEDANYYYIGENTVGVYKPLDENVSTIAIDNPPSAMETAFIYNNRLYAVANGHIYRYSHDERANTFYSRQDWLKDPALGKTSSLAIDGRIYVIENNAIAKFSGGQRDTLSLDTVSPALEEPTTVGVSPDLDFLYVLEAKNKRLLIFSKSGKYLSQYTGDQLDNLKAFAVDQQNKLIYFLNGQSLIKTEATHLK